MRISKIFRKYSRVLLLVFMSLLLIVFLVGDVVGRSQQSRVLRDTEIGQASGEPIYDSQIQRARSDVELTAQLGLNVPQIQTEDIRERYIAMHLLIEEARRAGVRVGKEVVVEYFRSNPRASASLNQLRGRGRRSLDSTYAAIGRVQAVMDLADLQARAAFSISQPELELMYRSQRQEARVLVSVIDSRAFLSEADQPGDEALQALFDQAKDRDAAHTEEELVFGYRLPDRVQVEYITIDPAEITADIHVREKEARRYYEDNQPKYMKTVKDESEFKLDDSRPQRVQMTYEEARDRAREDCRGAKALRAAQSELNRIQETLARPWVTAPVDDDGVRQAPPDDQVASFADLCEQLSTDYPLSYHKTDLVSLGDLQQEAGFAKAVAMFSRRPVSGPLLAFRVEGLASSDDGVPVPVLRVNEPSPVLIEHRSTDDAGRPIPYQAYFFRVVQAAPAGPPDSIDDVRTELLADAGRLAAFELAGEQAEKLASRAREMGLEQAATDAAELLALLGESEDAEASDTTDAPDKSGLYVRELGPFEPARFSRQPASIPNVGRVVGLHKAIFELADEVAASSGRRVVVTPAVDVGSADSNKWIVAELLEVKPIYQGDFEASRGLLERQAGQFQARLVYQRWFAVENIFKRAGFVATQPASQ